MIVVSGEALMDVFAGAATPSGVMLDARFGGSPLNVATGLARLAQPVAFFGGLSSGFLGDRLLAALHSEGVDITCTARLDARTTLGLVGLDSRGAPSYVFYGEGAADRLLPLSALATVPQAQAFHFGSYAMVLEPVAATLRALIEREFARSVIAYDPNVRPSVEPDLARWREAFTWMVPHTHLLKTSDEDLGLLFPGSDAGQLASSWLAQGVSLVVVTRGAEGAAAWTAQHHVQAPPVPVAVVDTVGAGDAFQAALLTALAERGLLRREALRSLGADALGAALRFAALAAAITCSRRGADLPRRAELPGA